MILRSCTPIFSALAKTWTRPTVTLKPSSCGMDVSPPSWLLCPHQSLPLCFSRKVYSPLKTSGRGHMGRSVGPVRSPTHLPRVLSSFLLLLLLLTLAPTTLTSPWDTRTSQAPWSCPTLHMTTPAMTMGKIHYHIHLKRSLRTQILKELRKTRRGLWMPEIP